ncbi:hypothetical protein HY991_00655 [Candidatus Micrarchaeota archaeon]|nr:hypothetical protein [Candidatus Micrarchaeota archaeon]
MYVYGEEFILLFVAFAVGVWFVERAFLGFEDFGSIIVLAIVMAIVVPNVTVFSVPVGIIQGGDLMIIGAFAFLAFISAKYLIGTGILDTIAALLIIWVIGSFIISIF